MNLADHAMKGVPLTDHRIDHYTLLGHYGEARQEAFFSLICAGRAGGRFRLAIQAGEYGPTFQKRFADTSQLRKRKRTSSSNPLLLEDFI
jgi:hypothetical protein